MNKMTSMPNIREMPRWLLEIDSTRPISFSGKPPSFLRQLRRNLHEKFSKVGAEALPDTELLELVLFRSLPRADVKQIAKLLIEAFGDYNRVLSAPISRLIEVPGIDIPTAQDIKIIEASAHRLARARIIHKPVVSSWSALLDYCHTTMAHKETEHFNVLYLDRKNTLIADEEQSKGTIDHVPVYPREVVKRALELNASAIILVHNHPSGDPTPSKDDINMTTSVARAASALGISLHDHIIIGKEREVSMKSSGYIQD